MTASAPPALELALEQHRRELVGYCYRMLASPFDADDAVQDTFIKAWRAYDRFEGRSSLRSWLYKIATNACFDVLDKASRRGLPTSKISGVNPQGALPAINNDPVWLDPFPDDWIDETTPSAEAHYTRRESVNLAFFDSTPNFAASSTNCIGSP